MQPWPRTDTEPLAGVLSDRDVSYLESDGESMGETEPHIRENMRLLQTLDSLFADRDDIYVGGDLLVYYLEGDPTKVVVPDVFVALGFDQYTGAILLGPGERTAAAEERTRDAERRVAELEAQLCA